MLLSYGLLMLLAGCADPGTSQYALGPDLQPNLVGQTAALGNPLFVPITDPQCVSDMTAEVVDDYFKIAHEEPVRLVGNTLTEGHIDTFPEVSPTLLGTVAKRYGQLRPAGGQHAANLSPPGGRADFAGRKRPLDRRGRVPRIGRFAAARTFLVRRGHLPLRQQFQPRGKSDRTTRSPRKAGFPKAAMPLLEQRILGHLQYRAQELRGR